MKCLFCDNGDSFKTKEHIIPESMGNDDLILENEICDKCQNYLSQIENYVLNKTPIGFWRILFTTRTKKNKLPSVDFNKKTSKGAFPDYSPKHDNVKYQAHSDFTTELVTSLTLEQFFGNNESGKLKYVVTPKVIHEIGRFLGKVGIEVICLNHSETARLDEFKNIRKYVRRGSLTELWPIFHSSEGDIKSLFEQIEVDGIVKEKITLYFYRICKVDEYVFFNLKIGTDNWFICLNEQFPPRDIIKLLDDNVNLIWYSKNQW